MFEREGVLWTWALEADPRQDQVAERLADHRMAYLDYEGPISGDRGTVTRWDAGEYAIQNHSHNRIVVRLSDGQLMGEVQLRQIGGERWEYQFIAHASTPRPRGGAK